MPRTRFPSMAKPIVAGRAVSGSAKGILDRLDGNFPAIKKDLCVAICTLRYVQLCTLTAKWFSVRYLCRPAAVRLSRSAEFKIFAAPHHQARSNVSGNIQTLTPAALQDREVHIALQLAAGSLDYDLAGLRTGRYFCGDF